MGQIAAEFGYMDQKPVIRLKASSPRSANRDIRYIIHLDHIWRYSEQHYEPLDANAPKTFEGFMMAKCLDLYELFDLGAPSSRQMAETAWLIQDSIDKLLNMPPEPPTEKKAIGEAKMQIDGSQVEAEIEV
jgi:hypothetical protein